MCCVTASAKRLQILRRIVRYVVVAVVNVQVRCGATRLAGTADLLSRYPSPAVRRLFWPRIRTGKRAIFPLPKCGHVLQGLPVALPPHHRATSPAGLRLLFCSLHHLNLRPARREAHQALHPFRVQGAIDTHAQLYRLADLRPALNGRIAWPAPVPVVCRHRGWP